MRNGPLHPTLCLLGAFLLLGSCKTVGPDYLKPGITLPAGFSQGGITWERTSPDDLPQPRAWWKLFGDHQLSSLIEQANANNQQLAAAAARLRQARELTAATRSRYFPAIDIAGDASRSKFRFRGPGGGSNILNSFTLPLDLDYEIDAWGKVRRMVESAKASEDATRETLTAMRLTIGTEVARTYWALRAVDADRALFDETLALRRKALGLITKQHEAGSISGLDLSRAQSEVSTAEAERSKLDQSRADLVNALAILTGSMPSGSSIGENPRLPAPPRIPASVPSRLLLQRPDIRASERLVAAANADVGVATAAFFPSFKINASAGFDSAVSSTLLSVDSIVWAIGAGITQPISAHGLLRHQLKAAIAARDAAAADYRQNVLEAVGDVETALQAGSILEQRLSAQRTAVAAARKTRDLSMKRYLAGLNSFLDVVDAERTHLAACQAENAILAERLAVATSLVKAIGGEW